MNTPNNNTQRPLNELIAELKDAVQAGDRNRAVQLEQLILQRLAAEAYEIQNTERTVHALMEQLDKPEPVVAKPQSRFSLTGELGGVSEQPRSLYNKIQVDPSSDAVIYPVWFGTNRKPNAQGDGYTGERHEHITRGRVDVRVPTAHRFGETGTAFWKRLLRFDIRDDRLRLQRIETLERDGFFSGIHEAMEAARENGEQSQALFFLHGFNVSFEEAAIRAAQIGYDLKVPGATAFFSWPSRGTVTAYPVDEASIEASEGAITNFLVDFAENCKADKIHVIAHSMGNRGLLRALQRIAANAETRGRVKFGQIFLAAPDVDRDLFLDLASLYPEHAERTTLYASNSDLPVHASSKLHDAPRAGYFTPYTVASSIDTVAVPNFNIDLLGHSYFAQAEALLHDIYDLMRHNEPPAKRQRIEAAVYEGKDFWSLKR